MNIALIQSTLGDWQALYIDGKLTIEGHKLEPFDVLCAIEKARMGDIMVEGREWNPEATDQWTLPHALEAVREFLVLAEKVADLAPADADVARGDVGVGADVPEELAHEALAEAHDLVVGLALGIEVRAALAAAAGSYIHSSFKAFNV
tara:strand:+ start:36938 stop:37381 length:444 start_codon:yes stop_codon:yes gene_type:complete